MRNELIVFFTTLVVLFIQITVLPATFLKGLGLMLPIIYLIALTAHFPLRTIFINAFIIGVVQDNFSGGLYGFHTIALIVLIYITARQRKYAFRGCLCSGAVYRRILATYEIVFVIWSMILKYSVGNWPHFLLAVFTGIISSIVVAYPVNGLCERLYRALTAE